MVCWKNISNDLRNEFDIIFSNLLQQQDSQILQVCLDALHNILKQTPADNLEAITTEIEECGGRKKIVINESVLIHIKIGLDKIENLQTHSNHEIYQQSYEIIEKYFSNENVSLNNLLNSLIDAPFLFCSLGWW